MTYFRYLVVVCFTKFLLLLVLHHKCYDFALLGSNWGQHSRIFKLIPYNFSLYVKKTSHFPTKTGRFMVAETGLEPAASGL